MTSSRSLWSEAMINLGGLGYRPKTTSDGLLAQRLDGSTIHVGCDHAALRHGARSHVTVDLTTAFGNLEHMSVFTTRSCADVLDHILEIDAAHPPPQPPRCLLTSRDRIELAAAYAAYAPELDQLADHGIDGYIDHGLHGLRIFSNLGPDLLIDISIGDGPLPLAGPDTGTWTILVTGAPRRLRHRHRRGLRRGGNPPRRGRRIRAR